MRITLALLAMLVLAGPAAAQEAADSLGFVHVPPIVVTATRTPTATRAVGISIAVVTREEIERHQYRTVLDVLRAIPGVAVAQTGTGGVASAFIRGAGADHAVVLVDGIELGDPSAPNGAYDLADLAAADIERIEVVRGPASPLYGSSAMGGVIHIVSRSPSHSPRLSALAETGTRGGGLGTLRLAAGSGALTAAVSATARRTDGFSTTGAPVGSAEADGHDVGAISARLDWRPSDVVDVQTTVRGSRGRTERDQEGPLGDDPDAVTEADLLAAAGRATVRVWDGRWESALGISLVRHDRQSRDDPDAFRPAERSRGAFDGERWKFEWRNLFEPVPDQRLVVGIETERERASTTFASDGEFGPFESALPEVSARTTGLFLQHQAEWDETFAVTGGVRLDAHSRFGRAATWRAAASLALPGSGTRLRASLGTAFKAPTLLQLFDPQFGNARLAPERGLGWDAGAEHDLARGRLRIGGGVFGSRFEDLVGFEFPAGFRNTKAAEAHGVEAWVSALPAAGVRVRGSYSFTDAVDVGGGEEDGLPLLRRPRHQASVDAEVEMDRMSLAASLQWVGSRDDLDFSVVPARRAALDSYALVRIAVSREVFAGLRLLARVENLLDEEYAEALHFETPGRTLTVGGRFEL